MSASVTAIILAAGYSSRMGTFKPLLSFGGTTVLERAIELFRAAGISDIRVVVGHRAGELLPLLERMDVRPVLNERYQDGMFSSVVAAAESLEDERGAFFLLPVDIPLVRRQTVELLLRTYQGGSTGILYPAFRGTRGHPPLLSCSYRTAIISFDGSGGLKTLLMQYEDDSATLECGDEGVLLDMDTPEDYERLHSLVLRGAIPSRQVCLQLLDMKFEADSPIVEHSHTVARVALHLAGMLNKNGCHLDLSLIEAAALLHDLAKGERDHAAAGAALLEQMGYGVVADLVAVHTDLPPHLDDGVDGADLLYLADKLVDGSRVMSLESRFSRPLERYTHDPLVVASILRRLESARTIQRRVETYAGCALDAIFANFTDGVVPDTQS